MTAHNVSKEQRDLREDAQSQVSIACKLTRYFKDYSSVIAVYLFGSSATGRGTRFSDVDVAVLFDKWETPGLGERLKTIAELSRLLKREVDLVFLNNSSCILRMQVIKRGRRILNKEPREVNKFVVATLKEYFDLKQVRRPIEQKLSEVTIFD